MNHERDTHAIYPTEDRHDRPGCMPVLILIAIVGCIIFFITMATLGGF